MDSRESRAGLAYIFLDAGASGNSLRLWPSIDAQPLQRGAARNSRRKTAGREQNRVVVAFQARPNRNSA